MATEWPLPNTYPEVGICTGPDSTKTPHGEHTFNILPPSIYLQYSSCDALVCIYLFSIISGYLRALLGDENV